ncbi:DEAD/DEAH box helicase [Candidatus Mycoplasma pogonae]
MSFNKFNLSTNTMQALEEMGFTDPSPIQEKVLPLALEGKDIIGQAQTGTGKTGAFAIPIIENTDPKLHKIQHLILAPTRELATQIFNQVKMIGKYHNLNVGLVLGGVSYERQLEFLKGRNTAQILIATPGRIEDLSSSHKLDYSHLRSLTLDEADELLKIGFLPEITKIINHLPEVRQNFFFTATFDAKTKKLSEIMTKNPEKISISKGLTTSKSIDQQYVVLKENEKLKTLVKFLDLHKPKSAVIFGRTKKRVDELTDALNTLGFEAAGIQGNMQQRERNYVMDKFRNQKVKILVATDVMARGIDVDHIDWVFNLDLPQEIEYYTHRIGRTGRASRLGHSLSFVKPYEIPHIQKIAQDTNSVISRVEIPTDEKMKTIWEEHLFSKLTDILEKSKQKELFYIQAELEKRYTAHELATLLSDYIQSESKATKKDIKLSPEPSVVIRQKPENKSKSGSQRKYGSKSGSRSGGDRGRSRTNRQTKNY